MMAWGLVIVLAQGLSWWLAYKVGRVRERVMAARRFDEPMLFPRFYVTDGDPEPTPVIRRDPAALDALAKKWGEP